MFETVKYLKIYLIEICETAVADKYHIPVTLDNKAPQTPWIGHLPAIIFRPRQYHFIKSPRQQKFA